MLRIKSDIIPLSYNTKNAVYSAIRKFPLTLIICLLFISILPNTSLNASEKKQPIYEGPFLVKKVIDGDTIELSDSRHVRYIGINTPETKQKTNLGWIENPEPFSREAKEFNRKRIEGKKVYLEFDTQKNDKYARLLAYTRDENYKMINLELVKNGLAIVYTFPPNTKYLAELITAQEDAKKSLKGIWSNPLKIEAKDAHKYIGKFVIINGTVKNVIQKKDCALLTFFDAENHFKIIVLNSNMSLFSSKNINIFSYQNKPIAIFGKIKGTEKSSHITVDNPTQIINI
ncbi:thermonuclease [Candidatus Omnitrophus magneticus]|uniref:Thermonuclease n=1 Tax=Candidatus Omnitrophus magneticus TaxID=1609969 RepID=A0A0F0CP66_9BACT|nr:thermonuclease [Candidatus Omnitrophus magneticus]